MSLVPLSSAGHCCRLPQVDWAGLGAEIMLDCSGKFLNREKLQPYFDRVRCPLLPPPALLLGLPTALVQANAARQRAHPIVLPALRSQLPDPPHPAASSARCLCC